MRRIQNRIMPNGIGLEENINMIQYISILRSRHKLKNQKPKKSNDCDLKNNQDHRIY